MSIIPDYAHQAQELIQQLEASAEVTSREWSDGKRYEYFSQYVEEYFKELEKFLYGNEICGKGINDLLQFVADKIDEFDNVSDTSIAGNIIAPTYSAGTAFTPGSRQIFVSPETSTSDMKSFIPEEDIPEEQLPENISRHRAEWTVDYNLNSPGSFSAQNLREILRRRKEG